MLHMELTVLENVVSFSIAELCCYGDRPYTEKKRKLGNTVMRPSMDCNKLNAYYSLPLYRREPSQ